MERMDVFKKNYLVAGLDDQTVEEIAELGSFVVCNPREILINKGQSSADLFVILDGTVEVYTPSGDKLTDAGPGSVLGEIALVDDRPRSANAVAVEAVSYVRLPAKELRGYMMSNKEAGFLMLANLCRVLSMRLRDANLALEDLMGKALDPWKFAR